MVKKERVDKTKNKIKVIKELLRDPLQTEREIAKNCNIAKTTVHRAKKDMDQIGPKSNIIDEIIKNDAEIVKLTQAEIQRRILEER
jgi:DNA invertase Pin-like site-specific DNA recombinase